MTMTTEKIIDLLETETDEKLVNDVETLEKMGYASDTIQALLIMIISLRFENRMLNHQMDIAENALLRD